MPKSNIKIIRYSNEEIPAEARCANGEFPWEASIECEGGDWVIFVPKNKTHAPSVWMRVGTHDHGDGTGEDAYALAGSPEHKAFVAGEKVDVSNL